MQNDSLLKIWAYKVLRLVPDRWFLSLKYYKNFNRWMDWGNPRTFNEKMQWLKAYNHRPEYTRMVDKAEAKEYVAGIIGREYIIPTLGVWDRAEDIDFDALPDKFVLKATHDSGRVVICRDKGKLDRRKAVEEMRRSLRRDFYAVTREWPYKNVKPRVIAEVLLEDDKQSANGLNDYKLMCFNGKVFCTLLCTDRDNNGNVLKTFYDREWKMLPFGRASHNDTTLKPCPARYADMLNLAERLAADQPFLRVDFYEVNGRIYFGELTFFPGSGVEEFDPEEWDLRLGDMITLPQL